MLYEQDFMNSQNRRSCAVKSYKFLVGIVSVFVGSFLLFFGNQPVQAAESESQCVICHTSPKKLIKITREIAKSNEGKSATESKSKGEG
jgi:pyridoxal biosynthesis lyase PdxS